MTMRFFSRGLTGGVWEGSLQAEAAPGRLLLMLNGAPLGTAEIAPEDEGVWRVRVGIPAETLADGAQTYVLLADDGQDDEAPRPGAQRLGHLPLIAGEALDADLRAEIDLLRAEIDLLKREFRQLATG